MAIIWNKIIPRWGGDTMEPPEAKKDVGYIAGDNPPAKWENWLRKGTYEALDETRDVIENIDTQLAQIGTLVTLTRTNALSVPNGTTIALPFEVVGVRTSSNFADFYELKVDGNLLIKKSGVYSVSAAIFFDTVPASQDFQDIAIKVGSVTVSFLSHREFFLETNINITLSANDIVSVLTKQTTGSSINILSSNFAPRLSVAFLGGN